MDLKRKTSLLFFGLILFIIPLLSTVSNSNSEALAIAAVWDDNETGSRILATSGIAVGGGAGIALALGAICPPQFAIYAVVGM